MLASQTDDSFRLGTRNVQFLKGKEMEVIAEMKKYKLDVLGARETKWKGNRAKNIDDCYVVYSGVSDGRAKVGVAVLMTEDTSSLVNSWQCVNERIVVVKRRWVESG